METEKTLSNQITQLKEYLLVNGYKPGTIRSYTSYWNHLVVYAKKSDHHLFSHQLGVDFLYETYGVENISHPTCKSKNPTRSIKLLESFLDSGNIASYRERVSTVPKQFSKVFEKYLSHLNLLGQKPKSLKSKISRVRQFLVFLDTAGINSIELISSEDIIGFMTFLTQKYVSTTRGNILYTVKDFLNFCVLEGISHKNLPQMIKCIYTNPNETMPSVYTSEEIGSILKAVNRNSIEGKKEYAILVLAALLGIRASDIINMKLADIKWNQNVIEFYQQKSGFFIQLPLMENIGYALIDYIKNSRPDTDCENLFVRSRAPIVVYKDSATIFSLVTKYIKMAGIETEGRHHGSHSLRHSMASCLLENKTSLPVIAATLGHSSTKNTSRYLRIDIELLRSIALEVPK